MPTRTRFILILGLLSLLSLVAQGLIADEGSSEGVSVVISGDVELMTIDTITVNGVEINISDFEYDSAVFPGLKVTIEGLLRDDGSIVALRINLTGEDGADEDDGALGEGEFKIIGTLEEIGDGFIVVSGQMISTEGLELDEDLQVDDLVEVRLSQVDDMLVASAVEAAEQEDDSEIKIVIEGPVETIEDNLLTIFGFVVQLDSDDPLLTVIQIGDVLHIEGDFAEDGTTIIVVVLIFVDIDIFVFEDQVWRDSGNCQNGPPPWAPAHGWRNRCESGGGGKGNAKSNKRSKRS